jgi:hypothetical protein
VTRPSAWCGAEAGSFLRVVARGFSPVLRTGWFVLSIS